MDTPPSQEGKEEEEDKEEREESSFLKMCGKTWESQIAEEIPREWGYRFRETAIANMRFWQLVLLVPARRQRIYFWESYDLWLPPHEVRVGIRRRDKRTNPFFSDIEIVWPDDTSLFPNGNCSNALHGMYGASSFSKVLEAYSAFWTEDFNLDGASYVIQESWFQKMTESDLDVDRAELLRQAIDYGEMWTHIEEISTIFDIYFKNWESRQREEVIEHFS